MEKGKRGDLILINGNPLEDIHNTRNVEYVITNGTMYHTRRIVAERGIQAVSDGLRGMSSRRRGALRTPSDTPALC